MQSMIEVKFPDFYSKKSLGNYAYVKRPLSPTEEVEKYQNQKMTHLSREGQACEQTW